MPRRKKGKRKNDRIKASPASMRDGFNDRSLRQPDRILDETTGKTLLIEAVMQNDSARVAALLKAGANPDKATKEGKTPLHYAARLGFTRIAAKLLDAGAQANPRGTKLETPLFDALFLDDPLPMLDLLLSRGANAGIQNALQETPLHAALADGKDIAVVKRLLSAMENADVQDEKGMTPFLLACRQGRRDAVESFVFERVNLYNTDRQGNTCLHLAAENPDGEAARFLLAGEAARLVNAVNLEGRTPLQAAIHARNEATVIAMIAAGANLNLPDSHGTTPLHDAAASGSGRMAFLLMQGGADIMKAEKSCDVPLLLFAIRMGNGEAAGLFLDAGANPDLGDKQRITPLMEALARDNAEIAQMLLERGANPALADHLGRTCLHHLGGQAHEDLIGLLVKAGAPIDGTDNWKRTPLTTAVQDHHLMTALILLDAGANPNLPDTQGFTPLHIAVSRRNFTLVEALLRKKADPNISSAPLRITPLHTACGLGLEREAALLLQHGAKVGAKDHTGRTPLHSAAQTHGFNTVEIAKTLLRAGADPTAADDASVTPYDLAWSLGKTALTELFRKDLQKKGRTYKPKRPPMPPWGGGYF